MSDSLRVVINGQIGQDSGSGGIETVLTGLVAALGRLDGPEEYVVVGPADDPAWLAPFAGSNVRFVPGPRAALPAPVGGAGPLGRAFRRAAAPARRLARRALVPPAPAASWPSVSVSDGFFEGLGGDVLHFPYQSFVLAAVPTIYNPHDLQHRHYPQYFTPEVLAAREVEYRAGCTLSQAVAVGSGWVRDDVVRAFGVDPARVSVIPWASPTAAHAPPSAEAVEAVRARYGLEPGFAFYPAMTWPHKNHLRLLAALARLRDERGLRVPLVCTGHLYGHWSAIEAEIARLGLGDQVRMLGLVPGADLRALYRSARFVVVPTLFEAASAPLIEAWIEGVPTACSAVTSLPEQVRDASLLFDPLDVGSIAAAVERMATDEPLRRRLVAAGRHRLAAFSWDKTARAYRALYRRTAQRPLDEDDVALLATDWMAAEQQPAVLSADSPSPALPLVHDP